MNAIPKQADNPRGLHILYNVSHCDGTPVDPLATYFVLRLDQFGDFRHAQASRCAAREYARAIIQNPDAAELHTMARQLYTLCDNIERA